MTDTVSNMENNITMHSSVEGWARPLLILFPYLLIAVIFQLFGYEVLGLDLKNFQIPKTSLQNFVISLFTLIGTIVVISIFRRIIDKESFLSLGFYSKDFLKESIIGLSVGALIMTFGFVILVLMNEIKWVSIYPEPTNLIFGVLLFVSVAVSEELLMRGYILNNLMLSMPRMVALLISSIFFSFMHAFNDNFSWLSFWNIILAGLLLGLPYIYTKSLWLPIALHFSWNFFQGTIFGFKVSGQETYSLFAQTRTSDNIWNGGTFGFEGSVLSIVFQSIAILCLWWYYNRKSEAQILYKSEIAK